MTHDHYNFNAQWAASVDEAAFVAHMLKPVKAGYIWARRTDEENAVILKEIHQRINGNGSGNGAKVESNQSNRGNGRGNRSKSTNDSGQEQVPTDGAGGGQESGTAGTVQE